MAYVDPPQLGDRADLPTTLWRVDPPAAAVDRLPAVPHGVVIPDGVVANFTGAGASVATLITKPGVYANFTGRGSLTASIRAKVPVIAAFTGEGSVDLTGSLPARFTGAGGFAAVAYPGKVLTADFTGSGALTAPVVPVGTTDAPFTGSGTATGAIAVPVTAEFTGSGALSATVLGGIPVAAAFTGSGALAASSTFQYAIAAPFTGSGQLGVQQHTFSVNAPFTGSGTLSAVVAPQFNPSRMTKNGNSPNPGTSFSLITSWTADTGGYPGSSVSSNGLVVQNTKTGATVATSIVASNAAAGAINMTIRLKVGTNVVATSAPTSVPAFGGTATIATSGLWDVVAGDLITLEAMVSAGVNASVTGGANSWVRIT
ncbi:hypothetical protein [Nocardia sp. NPDC058480]|uniref:hypothetical protein n=1 Tax=Nocardia sp. NPDC058480 TaxID=3346522 RepID=UPI00364D0791